jgi:hypothetical protein
MTTDTTSPGTILIGDLLVRSEMATPGAMADAVPISLKTGLPIGRVLIGSGSITEAHLAQSLLAQSLIRDSLLSVDLAIQALRIVAREGFNLEQALRIVGWQPESFVSENRLGQLLLAAEVVTPDQLDQALKVFYTAGLPLARVLVMRGLISNLVAYAALTSQQLLREKKLTREQAIQCVQAASTSRGQIEDNYVNGYLRMQPSHNMRLGELLVLSEIAREDEVMQAVEWAITRGETLGDVLVSRATIKEDELARALEAQRLVTKGELDSAKAGEVLKKANYARITVTQAMSDHTPTTSVSEGAAAPPQRRNFETEWLAEAQASKQGSRPRTNQETRLRELGVRLLQKMEALFTRNSYLKNVMDGDHPQNGVSEDRDDIDAFKRKLEAAADFDECMDLVDKLIAKAETFSYHNGYLRSRLDTVSDHLEMAERLREAEQDAAAWRVRANSAIAYPPAPFVLERDGATLVSSTVPVTRAMQSLPLIISPEPRPSVPPPTPPNPRETGKHKKRKKK